MAVPAAPTNSSAVSTSKRHPCNPDDASACLSPTVVVEARVLRSWGTTKYLYCALQRAHGWC